MNILPFITVFLLVFALLSSSFFSNMKGLVETAKANKTFMESTRKVRDEIQIKLYKKLKKKHQENKPKIEIKEKKETPFKPLRERKRSTNKDKLNLFHLFADSKPPKTLNLAFTRVLQTLYGDKVSQEELQKLQKRILKRGYALSEKAKKKGKEIEYFELSDLFDVEDPLCYKILRGTNQYDVKKQLGVAPLGKYIYFEAKPPPLMIHYASSDLLLLLFGEKRSNKLLNKELKEERLLKRSEIQEFIPEKIFSSSWIDFREPPSRKLSEEES